MGLCPIFVPSFLDHSIDNFLHVGHNVTLAAMFWSCTRSHFMCTSCIHYVNIHHTHTWICMHFCARMSWSFNDLSQALRLSLILMVSNTKYMLSWWFKASCRRVILSVCSQDHICTHSVTHTLSHFVEVFITRWPSNIWTLAELLPSNIWSALSERVLLPRFAQSLRLSPMKLALWNIGIDWTDCH